MTPTFQQDKRSSSCKVEAKKYAIPGIQIVDILKKWAFGIWKNTKIMSKKSEKVVG